MKKNRVSLSPGNFKGLKTHRNYNVKPPKLGGGEGRPAPANIAKALGIQTGMPVHAQMMTKLFNHPVGSVSSTAKKMYSEMSQHRVKQSKSPY